LERLLTEHLYKNNSKQENSALCSPKRNFLDFSDFYKPEFQEKLACINAKKGNCGKFTKEYVHVKTNEVVEFPVYCDNRSCCICVEHKKYKYSKEHKKQIYSLDKSMRKPKAYIFTGWRLPLKDLTRVFCASKLLLLFGLLKRFSESEFSVHMEIKLLEDGSAYLHFHVVSAFIKNLRLVSKLWGRVIRYEKAIKTEDLSNYVSKYASKVPMYYSNFQENYYTLLVYKLQMHRFSPKINEGKINRLYDKKITVSNGVQFVGYINKNVFDIWERNKIIERKKEAGGKPPPNYILFDNLEREVYSCLKRSEFNRDGSKNYHPFIDSYQERMNKNKKKVVTLEDFYE